MNSYVSFVRLRLNARHLPVPPHISHATIPDPEHSRHAESSAAFAADACEAAITLAAPVNNKVRLEFPMSFGWGGCEQLSSSNDCCWLRTTKLYARLAGVIIDDCRTHNCKVLGLKVSKLGGSGFPQI